MASPEGPAADLIPGLQALTVEAVDHGPQALTVEVADHDLQWAEAVQEVDRLEAEALVLHQDQEDVTSQ